MTNGFCQEKGYWVKLRRCTKCDRIAGHLTETSLNVSLVYQGNVTNPAKQLIHFSQASLFI